MKASFLSIVLLLILAPVVVFAAPVFPEDGIWKSEDGTLTFFLQTYISESCVIVLSDGVHMAAFIDQNGPNETNKDIDAVFVGDVGYQFHLWGVDESGTCGYVFSSHPGMLMFPEPFCLELPAQ